MKKLRGMTDMLRVCEAGLLRLVDSGHLTPVEAEATMEEYKGMTEHQLSNCAREYVEDEAVTGTIGMLEAVYYGSRRVAA